MFGKNLKYYRLKNNMTINELAKRIGVTDMAISNYEHDKRTPDMQVLRKLEEALNIKVVDFMSVRDENLQFAHGEFRKNATLTKSKQELLHESIEEYFNRFFTVVNFLGSTVLQKSPKIHSLQLVDDLEICAGRLREWLKLSLEGPVINLINILENNGILVYLIDFCDNKFSGINGIVNGYPYIAVNKNMTPERQRFTISHELAHMAFIWGEEINDKNRENMSNGIAGAFLFPRKDALRELGPKRSKIQGDMQVPAAEFGISMMCLAYRAKELDIVSESAYKSFMIRVSQLGWKKSEPSRIEKESSNLFKQLVYRAIEEDEISVQRGAELLDVTYKQISEELSHFSGKE
ncbi:MAG: helix-turn-helix domain-containing protein [Sedimentibacter sp.]